MYYINKQYHSVRYNVTEFNFKLKQGRIYNNTKTILRAMILIYFRLQLNIFKNKILNIFDICLFLMTGTCISPKLSLTRLAYSRDNVYDIHTLSFSALLSV